MADSKPKLVRGDPGYVGRGVTPENTKFKKNQVANPYGRRGKPRHDGAGSSFDEEVSQLILQDIRSREGQCYRPSQVYLNGILKGVQKGHLPSIELYGALLGRASPKRPPDNLDENIDQDRQRLIDDALTRLAAKKLSEAQPGPNEPPPGDSSDLKSGGDNDE